MELEKGNLLQWSLQTDRVWINSELLRNNEKAKENLAEAATTNKNLLMKTHIKQTEIANSDTISYLKRLAQNSFNSEQKIYAKGGEQFQTKMKAAFDKALASQKAEDFLKNGQGVKTNLGTELANLFYSGSIESMETGQRMLLQELAKLNVDRLAENVKLANQDLAANAVSQVLNNFFYTAKKEKNTALSMGNEVSTIFSTIYDESNVMTVLSGGQLNQSDIKKLTEMQMAALKQSPEFKKIMNRAEKVEKVKQTKDETSEMTEIIINFIANDIQSEMYNALLPFLRKDISQEDKKEILETIKKLLSEGKSKSGKFTVEEKQSLPFTFTSKGAKGKSNFSLAAYKINPKIMGEKFKEYIVQNTSNNSFNIQEIVNSMPKKETEALDEIILGSLSNYHESLKTYLGGNSLAWQYYEEHYLKKVITLANRDISKSKDSEEITSSIHEEINKVSETIPKIKQYKEAITVLEKINVAGLTKKDADQIIKDSEQYFNMKDKKDRLSFEQIKKSMDTGDFSVAINQILERLKSKKSGYSNINGSIGEIFLTTILKVVYSEESDILEQRGASFNLKSQQAHADIRYNEIGIQSKMYANNNNSLYETTIHFNLDEALRYLRTNRASSDSEYAQYGDELTAFRFFLVNKTVLSELNIDSSWTSDAPFLQALELRIANFFRYTDGLSKEDLSNIANNFYIINLNIVPASLIFIRIIELLAEEDSKKGLFDIKTDVNITKPSTMDESSYRLTVNKNLLSGFSTAYAHFKSFTLNLSDLGVETFLSREQSKDFNKTR